MNYAKNEDVPYRKDLYEYLIDWDFTKEETQYAVSNAKIDWTDCLVKFYNRYYSNRYEFHSKEFMVEYFTSDEHQFTEREVEDAIAILKIDFKENAKNAAQYESKEYFYSKVKLIDILKVQYKYSQEDAEYAASNSDINYNDNALKTAKLLNVTNPEDIRTELARERFTTEEIEYVINNI